MTVQTTIESTLQPLSTTSVSLPGGTIADILLDATRHYPRSGLLLLSTDEGAKPALVTYPTLLEEARRILGGLRALDRRPGEKIALLLERAGDFLPAFWACVLGGYVPCPLAPIRNDPERWRAHLAHVHTLLDEPLLIATSELERELPAGFPATKLNLLLAGDPADAFHETRSDDPAVLVLTSGSTGNSKAVTLTHGNLLASMAGKVERQRIDSSDVSLNWISFDHVAALLETHLLPLFAGAVQLHIDAAAILADPLLFLRLVDRYRVSMTFAPNFLLGQINATLQSTNEASRAPLQGIDLSSLRRLISGGEATVVETGRRFLELLAPYGLAESALWPAFGMTETCAGSIYSAEFPHSDAGREFAALGTPISGLDIRIVDDNDAPVAPGEAGELQLRGPMVFGRYYNNEVATRAAFTADGWFRSGDIGRIDDGRLVLVGRSKDSIIVSGVNYFSHELEAVLEQLDGVERSFVAAFPTRPKGADTEHLAIAFAPSFLPDDDAKLHRIAVAIRNTTILLWGFRPALVFPLTREAFPKTSLGKTQRSILRKRLENGEFATEIAQVANATGRQSGLHAPLESESELAVADIYAELFGLAAGDLSATANFFDLGGTSLDILKLTRKLKQRFGNDAEVQIVTILQNPTIRALAARVDPSRRSQAHEYDPIVALQTTGDKTPLFCIHPGVGEVLVFVNLAAYFVNDRPFFALRARGFNPGEAHFQSFDELVDSYVAAIRKRQPHGPYAIAGYSYGGPVAFPIAKKLEAQGERVAFVGSIDAPPVIEHPRGEVDAVESAIMLAFFLSLIDRQQIEDLPTLLRSKPNRDPCDYLFGIASPERLAELDLDLKRFKAWAALALGLSDVGHAYKPSGSVESVTIFYADPVWGTKEDYLRDQLKRWDQFSRSPNRYIEVAGEHHTLLDPKHVAGFQATLRAELDRALDGR